MDGLYIREAVPGDYEAIHTLNKTALGYDYDIEKTKRMLEHIILTGRDKLLIAELGGETVGYIHAADYNSIYSGRMKNVIALAVDECARGRGIGKVLLTAVEDWAKSGGAEGIRLTSGTDREGAHAFYIACGYFHRKTAKNFVKYFEG